MAEECINRGDSLQQMDQQSPLQVEPPDDIFKTFSLRFDALTERIEALEREVYKLKKEKNNGFSQILNEVEMVDKATMVGESLPLAKLSNNTKLMSFGEILSLETKGCYSAGQTEGDSGNSLVQWRVRQELESIYKISLQNVSKGKLSDIIQRYPSPSSQPEDLELVLNTKTEGKSSNKNSLHELAMVPKRSSPAGKRRPQGEDAPAQVFAERHLFGYQLNSKGSEQNLFNFFSRNKNDDQPNNEFKTQRSSCSNSCSQKDVKIDQNIDLDFNLVENYDLENNNSIGSDSRTDESALCDHECCTKDNLKINLVDVNAVSHNYISETTNSANYGRHSFTFKDRPLYKSAHQNDSPEDEKFNYEGTNLQTSSSNYFDMVDQGKLSHEYDCPQQRNSFQLLVSPRGLNTMALGNQVGPAFTDRPNTTFKQALYQYDERSAGVMQFDQNRLKHMIEQLSPEKQASGDAFIDMDLQRPRANSSPQNFLFSPNKPLNKRSHEYTSDNLDMIIQEEEFSNAEITDETQQPKLENQMASMQRFHSRNIQQPSLTPNIAYDEIKEAVLVEESPQFLKESNEPGSKKVNTNQLYNVSKSPLIQPSFKQQGRLDELKRKNIPLNLNQGHHLSFGQASFQPFQPSFQMPQGINLQEAFSNPRFRYSDLSQARQMSTNCTQIGIKTLPQPVARVESVESQTQTTPQKMSFGIPPQDDQDLGQNKFFHSVDKQFQMDQLQWPAEFEPTAVLPPGRPQSVPVCFQQFEQLGQAPERHISNDNLHLQEHQIIFGDQHNKQVVDFKVNKFQLDSDRQSQQQDNYIQNQQVQPNSNNTNRGYEYMNQLFSDMNQSTNPTHCFFKEVQRLNTLLPAATYAPNQSCETTSGAEPRQQHQPQPPSPLIAPLARSKTLVKNTEHSSGIVDKTTQPTELTDRLNQNTQVVNFIRITKHQPSRKNMKQQLIFCQNEIREDYKFSKYLEQNRYNRLFNEKELLGEGGFGKVYKVEHVLDQRMYAIKQIQIHLGINEDFKKHSVYREIVAISQVQHKNVVRYHACWIESVAPDMKEVNKAVRKLEQRMKQKLRDGKNKKKDETNSEESKLDVNLSQS